MVTWLVALTTALCGFIAKQDFLDRVTRFGSIAVFTGVAAAFGLLIMAFVMSDFSVITVYQNSHTAKPLLYKITGVWGNHEG